MNVELTSDEIALLIRALDSHAYWELSDPEYRRDGFVLEPGAEDPEAQVAMQEADGLASRLEDILRSSGANQ